MIATIKSNTVVSSKKTKAPDGFEMVNVLPWHKKDSKYYELCPFYLKTDDEGEVWMPNGCIFENIYQNMKIYPKIHDIVVKPCAKSNIIWWEWNKGTKDIYKDGKITEHYYDWFWSIANCPNPIRYPVGFKNRSECLFSLALINGEYYKLSYLYSRVQIYYENYVRLVRKLPIYKELLEKLRSGVNLCITEVDVPEKNKRGLFGNVDEDGYFICTLENLEELIVDTSEAFGHGLCLANALLEDK